MTGWKQELAVNIAKDRAKMARSYLAKLNVGEPINELHATAGGNSHAFALGAMIAVAGLLADSIEELTKDGDA